MTEKFKIKVDNKQYDVTCDVTDGKYYQAVVTGDDTQAITLGGQKENSKITFILNPNEELGYKVYPEIIKKLTDLGL